MTFDKGAACKHNMEYQRGKTLGPHGYPVSSNIYVHEITNEDGKEWTTATGSGLAANKKFAFEALGLSQDEVSTVLMGLQADGQYGDGDGGNHCISKMESLYNLFES